MNIGDKKNGYLYIPISPTKLFLAANKSTFISEFSSRSAPAEVAKRVNETIASRARRYVYARDDWQRDFVKNTMSTAMEPTPLFKDLDRYGPERAPTLSWKI
jgi:Protein of unknown function (DUF4238)